MNFADQLRPLTEKVGGPAPAGAICGVSRQTINMWLRGEGNPNAATQAGAILLLSRATEIGNILRAQIPGNRNAEAFDEASKIVVREEAMRAALVRLEDLSRNTTTTRQMLRDRIQAILKSTR